MKVKRAVGVPLPAVHETAMIRAMRPLIRGAHKLARQAKTPTDARRLRSALRALLPDSEIRAIVGAAGAAAERSSSRPWLPLDRVFTKDAGKVRRRAPYDAQKLLERWTKEAAALITSLRDDVAEGVRKDVVAAQLAGTSPEELAKSWNAKGLPVKFGTLEGRTKTIARHQLTSLHSKIQSERARALGVSAFTWRTQGDGDVRDAHADLNGTVHEYANPPSEGLPGQPVNCRCWAESVISDEVAERLGVSFLPADR